MGENGIRPGPLAILRTNVRLSGARGNAKPDIPKERVSTKIFSSIIGVVATFAVGDLLLKRNYESYVAEKSGIEQEIKAAIQDFDQLEKDVVQIVESRRLAAQRLNLYAASKDVQGYLAFYKEYDNAIDQWNEMRATVQNKITSMTGCSSGVLGDEVRQQILRSVMSPNSTVNQRHRRSDVRHVVPEEVTENGVYSVYCPSRYLFYARPAGTVKDPWDVRSVFEVFQIMHSGFLDSLSRDVVACTREADALIKQKVAGCFETASPEELGACIKGNLEAFSPKKVCDQEMFGGLASFGQARFSNLDYRWDMARVVLRHYRDSYVNSRCQAKLGFWAYVRDWTCNGMRSRVEL